MALEVYAFLMIVGFFVFVFTGMPVGFAIMATGFLFGFIGFDGWLFNILPARIYGVITNYTLLAVPLFVFMGVMLEKSRIAERMLDVIGHLSGRLPGGMALAVILVGVLMGAATGIVGAAVVTLTLMALPTLLRRGYDPGVACGTICATGTLGQIIPPSLVLIVLADIMNLSVGSLFAAALMPGLLLAGLYLVYLSGLPLLLPFLGAEGATMSLVWVAILVAMNLQTSFLTPPFGWSLLFLKGVAPPEIRTQHIYRGIVPFVIIQLIALGTLFAWPDLALWLPRAIGW